MGALKDKTIVVGVCGGIAAYKAAELVRLLTAQQARVRVMMSRNAAEFITRTRACCAVNNRTSSAAL